MGGVGGVAPGGVVHDEQAAEFVEGGADAGEVGGIVDGGQGGLGGLAADTAAVRNSAGAGQILGHEGRGALCLFRQHGFRVFLHSRGFPQQFAQLGHAPEPEETGLEDEVRKMGCVAVIGRFLPDGEHGAVPAGSGFPGRRAHSPVDHGQRFGDVPVFRGQGLPGGLRVLVQRTADVRVDRGHTKAVGLQQGGQPEGPGRGRGVNMDVPAGQFRGGLPQRLFGLFFVGVQEACPQHRGELPGAGEALLVRQGDGLLQKGALRALYLVKVPAVRHFEERSAEPLLKVFAGLAPEGVGVEVQRGVCHLLVRLPGLHPGQVVHPVAGKLQKLHELRALREREVVADDVDGRRRGRRGGAVCIAHGEQTLVKRPVRGGLEVGLGGAHGAVHIALDKKHVGEALRQLPEDEPHVRVHELGHAGVEDEAEGRVLPVPLEALAQKVRHAFDEEGLHAGADQVLLLDDHQREARAEAAELRGRQGHAPQTALGADVDLHALRHQQGRMGNGPRPPGRGRVFQAGLVRPVFSEFGLHR